MGAITSIFSRISAADRLIFTNKGPQVENQQNNFPSFDGPNEDCDRTPLLAWLAPSLVQVDIKSIFSFWLTVLFAINVLSLIIDFVDVLRFALGNRVPSQ